MLWVPHPTVAPVAPINRCGRECHKPKDLGGSSTRRFMNLYFAALPMVEIFTMQTETVSWCASSCDESPSSWQVSSYPTSGSLQPSTLVGQWVLFGVYDGHGGDRASGYSRDHLLSTIASFAARPPDGDPITSANMSEALRLGFLKTDQVIDLASRRARKLPTFHLPKFYPLWAFALR